MRYRTLGERGPAVSVVGVGGNNFGSRLDEDGTKAVVHAALDAGVTLFDTADVYGPADELGAAAQGANETLIAGILDELAVRDRVLLATKGGHVRTERGAVDVDSSHRHLVSAVDASLRRLGVDEIALWQHHRPDPKVDYADVMQTLKDIHHSGKVRMIGLSNADPAQIRLASEILGDALVSVQNQFSPRFRTSHPEIELCTELGLAFLAWGPLGGLGNAKELAQNHPAFAEVATELEVSGQQVALAWELAQSPVVIPIPGAKRPESIRDSAAAADLRLSEDQLLRLDKE
jgi:aryl-alcohol dehydrogenase-like predicted oxidoreductase